jgi:DNA invertase Pin-like site-specific DNA recombinase
MAAERKRCAIYTRKSSEEGLEQAFNSLDAQREACVAYIQSQRHEGWKALDTLYDDGGYSGGSMERPALQALLRDIGEGKIDVVVVYKVDRLTRSLADFAKIVEQFDSQGISFVSVTQQFNTTSSMGRLTLNVLLSFAQFEREVTGERIRDKIAASKKKGMWMGGFVPLGYDLEDRKLLPNKTEADLIRRIYSRYLALGCVHKLQMELKAQKLLSKSRVSRKGVSSGGVPYSRGALYSILQNRLYLGEIAHRDAVHPGQHEAIVSRAIWDEVQARLKANSHARRTGVNAKAPSLLAGLLYDEAGHRLTPLHSTKKGKRYRYYTSQSVIRNGPQQSAEPLRIPAHEIELLVTTRLKDLFTSKKELLDALGFSGDPASAQQALVRAADKASQTLEAGSDCRKHLLSIVTRISVTAEGVAIVLGRSRVLQLLLGKRVLSPKQLTEEDELVLKVQARFRRLSGAVRMIVPPEVLPASGSVNEVLLKAIARGRNWYEMLVSGEVPSVHAIAGMTGLNESYVSRVLRCAFLSPELVAAAFEGRTGKNLTLDRLLKGTPASWAQQRVEYAAERVL